MKNRLIIKKIMMLSFLFSMLFFPSWPSYGQYTRTYQYYLNMAKDAISERDYRSALLFLETAQAVQPESPEVTQYLNMITHALQQRLTEPEPPLVIPSKEEEPAAAKFLAPAAVKGETPSYPSPRLAADVMPPGKVQPETDPAKGVDFFTASAPAEAVGLGQAIERERVILELDEEAWALQPDTKIEVGLDQEILVRGDDIVRYLAVNPDIVEIVRESQKEILLIPKKYGQTFFHVWDGQTRWTFYLETFLPIQRISRAKPTAPLRERYLDSFRLSHNVHWNAFYRGPSLDDLNRTFSYVRNYLQITGPSPYGDIDTSAVFYQSDTQNIEVTDYSLGLTGARWWNFKDIQLRAFDAARHISDLTMPGRDFFGAMVAATTLDDRFSFSALRGRDRSSFGFLSSRVFPKRDSYLEAAKVSYHPSDIEEVSLNYARIWGSERLFSAKREVGSVEYDRGDKDWQLHSEAAYDTDASAQIIWSRHQLDGGGSFFAKARNIPPNFATVVGPPAGRGEVGTEFSLAYQIGETDISHYLDLYRDRAVKNPSNEDAMNVSLGSNVFRRLSDRTALSGAFYGFYTPGTLADRRDFRLSGTLSQRMDILYFSNVNLSWSGRYQHSRSGTFSSGDYDLAGLTANLNLPFNRFLSYTAGYQVNYVKNISSGEETYPRVFTSGLYYNQNISRQWRVNSSAYYRNEQRTSGERTFLAGQDSVTVSCGLDYNVRTGMSLYADGRVREVWAQRDNVPSSVEASIRLGMRSEWDLGVSWNPVGIVQGYVFRDLNYNGMKDDGEPGIPGVRVKVGDGEAVTDHTGWYYKKVRARKVLVTLDINTIPQGYIFKDSADKSFEIEHGYFYNGTFALTTQSGIHGVVFYDRNQSGKPDRGDEFLGKVRLMLNSERQAETDSRGSYFFYNVPEGQHRLSLDLTSLPEQYLPMVPLVNDLEIADGAMYLFHIPVREK